MSCEEDDDNTSLSGSDSSSDSSSMPQKEDQVGSVERSLARGNKRSLQFEVERSLLEDIEANGGLHGSWSLEKQPLRKLLDRKPLVYPKDTAFRNAIRQQVRYLHEMTKSDYLLLLSQFSVAPAAQRASQSTSKKSSSKKASSKSSTKKSPKKQPSATKQKTSIPSAVILSPPKPKVLFPPAVVSPVPVPAKTAITMVTTSDDTTVANLEKKFGTYSKTNHSL
jgi:hypothetical protein